MQRLGELIGEDSAPASQPPQTDDPPAVADGIAAAMIEHFLGDVPRPIGIWEPVDGTDPQRFERDDGAINAHWWALPPVLEAKDALLPLRVAFIGESAASGWLYAPQLTPARLLEAHLQHQSPQTFEVLDLSAVNLQMEQMLELACASLQLSPDLLVVYAGNNWPLRLPSQASASLVEMQSAALALRGQGVAGLREVADALTRAEVERTLDVLGSLAGREGVPVVLVVPDVNLADWSRSRPVAWLERDRVDRWHDPHHRARAALVAGDPGGALTLADAMCALDDETCATSHHLRGRALAALGRHGQAADAWRQGVDGLGVGQRADSALGHLLGAQRNGREIHRLRLRAGSSFGDLRQRGASARPHAVPRLLPSHTIRHALGYGRRGHGRARRCAAGKNNRGGGGPSDAVPRMRGRRRLSDCDLHLALRRGCRGRAYRREPSDCLLGRARSEQMERLRRLAAGLPLEPYRASSCHCLVRPDETLRRPPHGAAGEPG